MACGTTTHKACGDFEEPENPDQGCCHAYRVKRDCERPALPAIGCDDTEYVTEVSNDPTRPFRVLARIFDEDCEPILDENGEEITAYVN